jgi:AraC-like DNA-binding protein
MGIHARTLQRYLKLEGMTFEAMRDGVRRDLARQLLRDRSHSIAQVSLQLHYATGSALTRNYRRWFRNSLGRVRELPSDTPRRPGVLKKRRLMQKNGRRQCFWYYKLTKFGENGSRCLDAVRRAYDACDNKNKTAKTLENPP